MRRSFVLAAAFGGIVSITPLHAQGSAVQTHSSCATAMGSSGVADPCADGSAVLFNPAALALQPSVLGIGITGITTSGSFTYDFTGETIEREEETSLVPFGFFSYRLSDRVALALGAFNPYGLTVSWPDPNEPGEPLFEGRFTSYNTQLRNIYVQPTVAYQAAPWLSFGAGLDVVLSRIEINQRVDLATTSLPGQPLTFANLGIPLGTDFADAQLVGDGTGVTFHVGALANVSPALSIGVRYLHSAEVDLEGDADFTQINSGIVLPPNNPLSIPGNPFGLPAGAPVPIDAVLAGRFASGQALADQEISTSLTLPYQLVVGAAFRPMPTLKLQADYQYTGWESFDEAEIDFAEEAGSDQTLVLDYQNTSTYRLGAELRAAEALALRAGFIFNDAAEKDFSVSPLLPEAERNYYSAGIGYRLGNGLGIDLGYQYVDQSDRRGRVRGRPADLDPADPQDLAVLRSLNVGVFSADASVLNLTLSYYFGEMR